MKGRKKERDRKRERGRGKVAGERRGNVLLDLERGKKKGKITVQRVIRLSERNRKWGRGRKRRGSEEGKRRTGKGRVK